MPNPLEQELRPLILTFLVDIRLAVLRSLQSSLEAAVALDAYRTLPGADTMTHATERSYRPPRTAEGVAFVAQITAIIRQHPDKSIAELARAVGTPTGKLRPWLRQLVDEGAILAEKPRGKRCRPGPVPHVSRAAELPPEQHLEPPRLGSGA